MCIVHLCLRILISRTKKMHILVFSNNPQNGVKIAQNGQNDFFVYSISSLQMPCQCNSSKSQTSLKVHQELALKYIW